MTEGGLGGGGEVEKEEENVIEREVDWEGENGGEEMCKEGESHDPKKLGEGLDRDKVEKRGLVWSINGEGVR